MMDNQTKFGVPPERGAGGDKMSVKEVRIGKTLYEVEIDDKSISVYETTYPVPGWGNNYGTAYHIYLDSDDDEYYRTEIYCYNNDWACRGHGMVDRWTEAEGFIAKNKLDIEAIKREFENIKDRSFKVYKLFTRIKDAVIKSTEIAETEA